MSLEPIEVINKDGGDRESNKWADDEDLEETLGERLWGLTEMFPEWLRNCVSITTSASASGAKSLYKLTRSFTWIACSSVAILMVPVIFEVENIQMEEMQKMQQRQILLGPNAAIAGGQSPMSMPLGGPPVR